MPLPLTLTPLDRLEQNLVSLVQSLNLTGTAGTTPNVGNNVYRQMLPEELNVQFPCVLVTSFGEKARDGDAGHSFETRGTAYPIRVMILDPAGPYPQAREGDYLAWNRTMARTFDGLALPVNSLPDCPECWQVETEEITHIDPRLPESQWFRGGIRLICHVSEARAFNI